MSVSKKYQNHLLYRDVLYALEDNSGIDAITSTLVENEEEIKSSGGIWSWKGM